MSIKSLLPSLLFMITVRFFSSAYWIALVADAWAVITLDLEVKTPLLTRSCSF